MFVFPQKPHTLASLLLSFITDRPIQFINGSLVIDSSSAEYIMYTTIEFGERVNVNNKKKLASKQEVMAYLKVRF